MTLDDLRALYRRKMKDEVAPFLWTDADIDDLANDAVMEAVRRGFLIYDSTTALICTSAYTTNPVLSLDPRVISIRSAIISGQTLPLDRLKVARMDDLYAGWRSVTARIPTAFVDDWGSGKIRLYPTPTASGTVLLNVAREPLAAMTLGTHTPEMPARFHRSLMHWMRARGYDEDDTETRDQAAVDKYDAKFTAEFGEPVSARNEIWIAQGAGVFTNTLC